MKGEVVGINSLIFSRTGGYMGLSFAIPIDVAMNVVKQIQEKGRVTRGRIGVQIQEVSKETADAFGLPKADRRAGQLGGEGRPCGQGGHRIRRHHPQGRRPDGEYLVRAAADHHPGQARARRSRCRCGARARRKDIAVTVAELKEDDGADAGTSAARHAGKDKAKPNRMGLVLSDLTDEQKKELEIKNGVRRRGHQRHRRAATSSRATSSWR